MIVVCKNPVNAILTKGKRYIVQEEIKLESSRLYRVEDDLGENNMCYSSSRFITLDQWRQDARDMIYSKVKLVEADNQIIVRDQAYLNRKQREKTIEIWNKYVHRRLKN
jgi:hypothetical protein